MTFSTSVGELWVELAGGKRIALETVLLDGLNDLIVLRPKEEEKGKELGARALAAGKSTSLPKTLDALTVLGRAGALANHVPTVDLIRVSGQTETPRKGALVNAPVGSPLFDGNGKWVGIVTVLSSGEEEPDMMMLMGGGGMGGMPVLTGCEAIDQILQRAKSVKKEF